MIKGHERFLIISDKGKATLARNPIGRVYIAVEYLRQRGYVQSD